MNEPFMERRARAMDAVRRQGARVFLASDFGTVRWLAGRTADIEPGPMPWSAGTHLLLVDGAGAIVCPEEEVDGSEDLQAFGYEAFTVAPSLSPAAHAAEALRQSMERRGIGPNDTVAIEAVALPAALRDALGSRPVVDVSQAIRLARAVKDAAEITAIRAVFDLVNAGQRAFREHARAGISEIALWGVIHGAMEQAAGSRVPALADLVSGERTAEVGGPPTDRILGENELVLADLVPRRDGYWGDSCVTICLGRAGEEMRRVHDAARRALDVGIRAAKPGITGGELDAVVRGVMQQAGYDFPHHSGHGVGLSVSDEPRIVPNTSVRLEENMVVALEPGSYPGPFGLRVEYVVLVRPGGGEVLAGYSLDLT